MPLDDGNQEDRPDERPQIISLKPGDLTEEEVAAVAASDKSLLPDELNLNAPLGSTTKESEFSSGTAKSDMDPEEKMVFRKPTFKRPNPTPDEDNAKNPAKRVSSDALDKPKSSESVMDKVRNKSLLSFSQDGDDWFCFYSGVFSQCSWMVDCLIDWVIHHFLAVYRQCVLFHFVHFFTRKNVKINDYCFFMCLFPFCFAIRVGLKCIFFGRQVSRQVVHV